MVRRRRQWYSAAGVAAAAPCSDAGAATHGTAAGFAKSWAALMLKCSCGSHVNAAAAVYRRQRMKEKTYEYEAKSQL